MRIVLSDLAATIAHSAILTAVLALQAGAAISSAPGGGSPAPPGNELTVSRSRPGGIELTLKNESAVSSQRPSLRLVALPAGATAPRVVLGEGAEKGTTVDIIAGKEMILRGVKVLPLLISPPAGKGASATQGSVSFQILYDEGPAAPGAEPLASRGFFDPYLGLFPGNQQLNLQSAAEGGYLIITAPELRSAIEPLAIWKREMGYQVSVVTTNETGRPLEEIQAFIRDVYENSPVPPQYVLLVGDDEQIPGYDYHQSVSDLPYALVDGNDFLPDLELGRLSAQEAWQLDTIVSKIVRYEQDPYRDNEEWFTRGLMVAGDYASSTPVAVARWCREQLFGVGYTAVDSVYYPPNWSTGPYYIKQSIDQGVSLVSYRGWAYGWQGWEPPKFTVDHIPGLENGWMLPAVFSFVCLNGNFIERECFGEAWIRAGTPTAPKGAVAFIGNSEHWSHTRHNDAAAIGAFRAIRGGVRRLGAILSASKYEIMEQFPDQIYYDPWADESVEFYFYIYSLLGDPTMEIWMAPPEAITVTHPPSIPQGANLLEVEVRDGGGVQPVAGARVGVSQGATLLGSGFTDVDGSARIMASFEDQSAPVRIVVTGTGLAPYRSDVDVVTGGPYLAFERVVLSGDGVANPGEALDLELQLENRGPATASGVSATLTAFGGAVVEAGSVTFPDIAPGAIATANEACVVRIDAEAEDGLMARFRVEAAAGGDVSADGFEFRVAAPALRYESHALGGDGIISPGETADLQVTIRNEGSLPASPIQAVLRAATPALATVADSNSTFVEIAVGEAGTTAAPFAIEAGAEAAIGQAAVFTLRMTTAEGYVSNTSFSVILGEVDHRAPLGPDAYGYYAYDNSDTDYPDAVPLYEWITCSTAYGGSGTRLELGDNATTTVTLPFDFTYYGESYNRLLVSDNGWAAFDTTASFDFYNWSMPNLYGNGAQLAPFWDNLDPTKEHGGQPVGDGIYILDDSANHRFVVEWSRLGNVRSHHPRPDYDELQTFELVLLDPDYYPTPTGDGVVRFQYRQIVNNDWERMYSTVGIENEAEDTGLEYTYSNLYPAAAAPLSAGLAIEFTTTPPRYSPFNLAWFTAEPSASGVELAWAPGDDRPRAGYRVYRSTGDGGDYHLVAGGILGPSTFAFTDADADPESVYSYKIGSLDPVGRETLLGPFIYPMASPPLELALRNTGQNPVRGATSLSFTLPRETDTRLAIYSISGRLVRTLVDGRVGAGVWSAPWDARDDAGRMLPNGVYFGRLETGLAERTVKLILLR